MLNFISLSTMVFPSLSSKLILIGCKSGCSGNSNANSVTTTFLLSPGLTGYGLVSAVNPNDAFHLANFHLQHQVLYSSIVFFSPTVYPSTFFRN